MLVPDVMNRGLYGSEERERFMSVPEAPHGSHVEHGDHRDGDGHAPDGANHKNSDHKNSDHKDSDHKDSDPADTDGGAGAKAQPQG